MAGNSNVLRPVHHYQKFKFHQQQEALAAHFDFTSFSARPFFKFLATTFFIPGVFWLGLGILGTSLVMAQDDKRYGFDIDLPGASCADIYNKNPTRHGRSGYYVLKTDHFFFAYCDMELECDVNKGGWMRIADINKEIPAQVDGLNTALSVQEDQQLVVTLLTFQHTPQVTARYVGRY